MQPAVAVVVVGRAVAAPVAEQPDFGQLDFVVVAAAVASAAPVVLVAPLLSAAVVLLLLQQDQVQWVPEDERPFAAVELLGLA